MRIAMLALAAAIATTSAAPAIAQPSTDRADVRCLLVLQVVSRDPKQRDSAVRGIYYFLGRLSARGGLARLDVAMLAEAKAMQGTQAQTELARCGAELTRRSNEFQAATQRAQRAGGPAPAPKAK